MWHVYISGLEHEFQQKLLPDGRISIDGFMCVFDVSDVAQRPVAKQSEHVLCILMQLAKMKKPIVLATTKNDELVRPHVADAEHLLSRKELRGAGLIPIVETSAHKNVNVEQAFMMLAHLIERVNCGVSGKLRQRLVPYSEALRAKQEVLDGAATAYNSLISCQVSVACCALSLESIMATSANPSTFGVFCSYFAILIITNKSHFCLICLSTVIDNFDCCFHIKKLKFQGYLTRMQSVCIWWLGPPGHNVREF